MSEQTRAERRGCVGRRSVAHTVLLAQQCAASHNDDAPDPQCPESRAGSPFHRRRTASSTCPRLLGHTARGGDTQRGRVGRGGERGRKERALTRGRGVSSSRTERGYSWSAASSCARARYAHLLREVAAHEAVRDRALPDAARAHDNQLQRHALSQGCGLRSVDDVQTRRTVEEKSARHRGKGRRERRAVVRVMDG